MKTLLTPVIFLAGAILFAGCSSNLGSASFVIRKDFDPTKAYRVDAAQKIDNEFTVGTAFLQKDPFPYVELAFDDAINQVPKCVGIANATIHHEWTTYVLFGLATVRITGNPVFEAKPGESK